MANNWFQFKEFKVEQGQCGMKVSTDACIQGALAAHYLKEKESFRFALDIGAGTGLLSLMMTQKNQNVQIDAIEIDQDAAQQAAQNFAQSKWGIHLQCLETSLSEWTRKSMISGKLYDFIICNPPFFQNHLHSSEKQRNAARHTVSLTAADLFYDVSKLLKPSGIFCVLYPQFYWSNIESLAIENGLFVQKLIRIQPKHQSESNRIVAFFSKLKIESPEETSLIIYETEKQYSQEFKNLLKDYYLNL